jgi:hypothetical protein
LKIFGQLKCQRAVSGNEEQDEFAEQVFASVADKPACGPENL